MRKKKQSRKARPFKLVDFTQHPLPGFGAPPVVTPGKVYQSMQYKPVARHAGEEAFS